MCQELTDELARGERAIADLARHLMAMGAVNMNRTVAIDNCLVTIKIEIRAKI